MTLLGVLPPRNPLTDISNLLLQCGIVTVTHLNVIVCTLFMISHYTGVNYTVSRKKFHSFCFSDFSVNCSPILIIFGNTAAEKICNQITCQYCHTFVQFLVDCCCFFNSLFSPCSPATLFGSFSSFFTPWPLKMCKFSVKIRSSLVKPIFTQKHHLQRAFGI